MGLFEINATTTMAYVFAKRVINEKYSFSIIYLIIVSVSLGSFPLWNVIFSNLGISWIIQPIISERPLFLASVFFSIGITALCFFILWYRLRNWNYILHYFMYLVVWGFLYIIIALLCGFRGYQITDAANPWLITILLVCHTAFFEVAGLMLVPLSLGALLRIKFCEAA